jgi:enoyl-CoA hydratase/carnithine racemase
VATVTMVRADKHNALDQAMFEGLMNAAEQLADDTSVRAVVLHGEGKSFCSGLDIASFMAGRGGTNVLLGPRRQPAGQLRSARDLRLVISAGASHRRDSRQLLRRRSADRARCRHPDQRAGRETVHLGDQVGPRTRHGPHADTAAAHTDRRRERVDIHRSHRSGSEAVELGLVTRTAEDPLSAALELAEEIAQKSPDAVRAAKRLYDETWTSNDTAAVLVLESQLQTGLIGKPNQIAAVVAGMSGEQPVFVDPE